MTTTPTPVFVRNQHPNGSIHYRLPDHERSFLAGWWIVLAVACLFLGWLAQGQQVPAAFGLLFPVGVVLFFSLIFLAGPLGWYFFKGRGEVRVTADTLCVWQKIGPWWRSWSVPLGEVQQLVRITATSGTSGRLLAHCRGRRLALSWGEPAELLCLLQADLAEVINRRLQERGLPPASALAVEEVRFPETSPTWALHVLHGQLIVEERCRWWVRARYFPLDDLQCLTQLSEPRLPNRQQLVAVGPGRRVCVLVGQSERDALLAFSRQVAEWCRLQTGRDVPLLEETNEPLTERPFQPVYSRVRVGWARGRYVFTLPLFGPVRLLVGQEELTLERGWWCFRSTRSWLAREIQTIRATSWTIQHSESGTTSGGHDLLILSRHGKTTVVSGLGRKDTEWLATTLRRLLFLEKSLPSKVERQPTVAGPIHRQKH